MIEELAAHILGVDVDERWEDLGELLFDEFNIDLNIFENLIEKLMPLCEVGHSPLTGISYRGFADIEKGMWLENIEIEQINYALVASIKPPSQCEAGTDTKRLPDSMS